MGLPIYQTGDRNITAKDILEPLVKGGFLPLAEAELLLKSWVKSKEQMSLRKIDLIICDNKLLIPNFQKVK